MRQNRQPDDATIVVQWAFKPAAMRAMLVDVLRVALRGTEFSALDLEHRGADAQGGQGVAGSVIRQLLNHGIIAPVGVWVDGRFFAKTVINDGGNPIKLYRLAKPELARTLLRAHSPAEAPELQQPLLL